jgi:hypothetical protein
MATSKPRAVPPVLSTKSRLEGTRCGSQFCRLSMPADSPAPTSTVVSTETPTARPLRTWAPNNRAPKGM